MSTETLSHTTITKAAAPETTLDGSTYTIERSSSNFVIAGQILRRDGVVTVSGMTTSYVAAGTDVVGMSVEAVGVGGPDRVFGGGGAAVGCTG